MGNAQWFLLGLVVVAVILSLEKIFSNLVRIMTGKHDGESKSSSYFYIVGYVLFLAVILKFTIDFVS